MLTNDDVLKIRTLNSCPHSDIKFYTCILTKPIGRMFFKMCFYCESFKPAIWLGIWREKIFCASGTVTFLMNHTTVGVL